MQPHAIALSFTEQRCGQSKKREKLRVDNISSANHQLTGGCWKSV
jgi:hypothetical protein